MNKLCDGADWFNPALAQIIRTELEETPRFHRKQWEFAAIYRQLQLLGLLDVHSRGLSLGSGAELVLYAIARRVGHLWATDLYDPNSLWAIARTDNPEEYIRRQAPLPVPDGRISAKSMDMRDVTFSSDVFDFAYSSCAIEHIGHRDDFIRHLREVRRVLKPGGYYVFTTEFAYTDQAIEFAGNYLFSPALLEDVVRESGFSSDDRFDCTLFEHRVNTPMPPNFSSYVNPGDGRFHINFFGEFGQVQLISANIPYTSCIITLRKSMNTFGQWNFDGLGPARAFIDRCVAAIRLIIEETDLTAHPFAGLPQRRSSRYIGHAEFATEIEQSANSNILFMTDFIWLGNRRRYVDVHLALKAKPGVGEIIVLHVCRCGAAGGSTYEHVETRQITDADMAIHQRLTILPGDDYCYAVRGEVLIGGPMLTAASVTFRAANWVPQASAFCV